MKDTTSLGDLAEWKVATALMESGKKVLRPVSNASRYDLVIDNGDGTFTRVQCKTGILRDGRVAFRLYSMSGHRGTIGRDYAGQVDAFGIYCPQNRQAYLVPMADIADRRGASCLRIQPARNGQLKRTRRAERYLIGSPSAPSTLISRRAGGAPTP